MTDEVIKKFFIDADRSQINWTKVRQGITAAAEPDVFLIKTDVDNTPLTVSVFRCQKNVPASTSLDVVIKQLGISQDKKKDIISLYDDRQISVIYRQFYESFQVNKE